LESAAADCPLADEHLGTDVRVVQCSCMFPRAWQDVSWHTSFISAEPTVLSDLDALDPTALKAMVVMLRVELSSHKSEIEHLKLLLAMLRRAQFGRKSEKTERQIDQLELRLEELEASRVERAEPPVSKATEAAAPSQKKSRSLPQHLPRVTQLHMPEHACCPDCGGMLKKLGEDISEMLEYIPASVEEEAAIGFGMR
jgi:transposase